VDGGDPSLLQRGVGRGRHVVTRSSCVERLSGCTTSPVRFGPCFVVRAMISVLAVGWWGAARACTAPGGAVYGADCGLE
jgi:hypothetical protein